MPKPFFVTLLKLQVTLLAGLCAGCQLPYGALLNGVFVQTWPVTNLTPTYATPHPRPISGIITDRHGQPIADASVMPEVLTPGVPLPQLAITSDAAGHYALSPLMPADYRLTIQADGYISETRLVTLNAGQPLLLNFSLRSAPPNP